MLLGGLWHGAGVTFIVWGGIHGIFLVIIHVWHKLKKIIFKKSIEKHSIFGSLIGRTITFLVLVISWVVFRADTFNGAITIYSGMFGINGISLPVSLQYSHTELVNFLLPYGFVFDGMYTSQILGESPNQAFLYNLFFLIIVWFMPNTIQWLNDFNPALGLEKFKKLASMPKYYLWRPNYITAIIAAILFVSSILLLNDASEFLYFQF